MRQAGDRIYVLSSGKVLEAFAADRKENVPVEAGPCADLSCAFFTLDPDDGHQYNITKRSIWPMARQSGYMTI